MAKPAHTRVVFNGVIGTAAAPLEEWSFSVKFPAAAIPADGTDLVADGVATDLAAAYGTNMDTLFPSDVVLTGIKVSHVLDTGHVAVRADGSYVQGEWAGEIPGLNTPVGLPLQTALCVSLSTGRAGPTGKGRFFLPWPSIDIEAATKSITEANAGFLATSVAGFLDSMSTVMTYAPQVVSSKGYMSEVLGVRIGRVPDTMRSRRADLPEGYASAPLA